MNANSIVTRPAKIGGLTSWDLFSDHVQFVPGAFNFLKDGRLDIYDGNGGHCLWDFEQGARSATPFGGYYALAPDQAICARIQAQSVVLYEKDSPGSIAHTLGTKNATCAVWSNGGDRIATYGADGLCIWDSEGMRLSTWGDEPVFSVNYAGRLVWAPDDRSVVAWVTGRAAVNQVDVNSAQNTVLNRITTESPVVAVQLRPQGDVIAVQCEDGVTRTYNLKSRVKLWAFRDAAVTAPAWSPDGQLLAFGVDAGVQVWDCQSFAAPRLLYTLDKPKQKSQTVIFAPHGDTLFSYDADGKLRLWEVQTGAHRGTILFLDGGWLAATPDGHYRVSPGAEDAELFRYQMKGDRDLKPKEFANKYHWVNDPDKVVKAVR